MELQVLLGLVKKINAILLGPRFRWTRNNHHCTPPHNSTQNQYYVGSLAFYPRASINEALSFKMQPHIDRDGENLKKNKISILLVLLVVSDANEYA